MSAEIRFQKSWQLGYTVGRAGMENAKEPYLSGSALAESLNADWRAGFAVGLRVWRLAVDLAAGGRDGDSGIRGRSGGAG